LDLTAMLVGWDCLKDEARTGRRDEQGIPPAMGLSTAQRSEANGRVVLGKI
jgi:hypothetical protein